MNDNLKSLLTGAAISLTSALAGGLLVAMTMSSQIGQVQPSQSRPTILPRDLSSFQPSHSPAKPVSFTTAPSSVPMPAAMESADVQKARAELMEAQAKFRAAMQAAMERQQKEAAKPATINPSGSVVNPAAQPSMSITAPVAVPEKKR